MAASYIQSAALAAAGNTADTTIAQAFSSNVTAGSFLIAVVSCANSGSAGPTITVSDNVNGSWTSVHRTEDTSVSAFVTVEVFVKANASAGATTVTATYGVTKTQRKIAISEYGGIATSSPVDQHTGVFQAGTAGTDAMTTGTVTTTAANDLLVGVGIFQTGGAAPTAGTGFTRRQASQDDIGFGWVALEDLLDAGATGSEAATWTWATGNNGAVMILVAAKLPGGGGGGGGGTPLPWLPVTRSVQGPRVRVVPSGFTPGGGTF